MLAMEQETAATGLSVLVVDDDHRSAKRLAERLTAVGQIVLSVGCGDEALGVLHRVPVQVVIAGQGIPGMSGLDLCRRLRTAKPPVQGELHFVLLLDYDDRELIREAFAHGVDDFLSKPLRDSELLARVHAWARCVRMHEHLALQRREAFRLNEELAAASADLTDANARLAERATLDELTGLLNRRVGMRQLAEAFAAARGADRPLACAIVDVDGFKRWNDTYGHAAGDRVLRQVAGVLRTTVSGATAYRLAGDEFLLLFPNRTAAEATAQTERARAALLAPRARHDGEAGPVTISAGVSGLSAQTLAPEDLLHETDVALYRAKQSGRNQVARAA